MFWVETNLFRFIKHEIISENSIYQVGSHVDVFTPEFSCNAEGISKKDELNLNEQINEQKVKIFLSPKPEFNESNIEDPDMTQLEIDINSASISMTQNVKKRQLVKHVDGLDLLSLHSKQGEIDQDL